MQNAIIAMQSLILSLQKALNTAQSKAREAAKEAAWTARCYPQHLEVALLFQEECDQRVDALRGEFRWHMGKLSNLVHKRKVSQSLLDEQAQDDLRAMEESAKQGADWWYNVFCRAYFTAKKARTKAELAVLIKPDEDGNYQLPESHNKAFSEEQLNQMLAHVS